MEDSQTTVQTEPEGTEQPVSEKQNPEPTIDTAEILKELQSLKKQTSTFQSQKDSAVAEAIATKQQLAEERRQREAYEAMLKGLDGEFSEDPDVARKLRDKTVDTKLRLYEERERAQQEAQKEQARKAQEARQFFSELQEDLEEYGLDLNDERLKEAGKLVPVGDFRALRKTLLKEAKKIAKGGDTVDVKYEELTAKIANLEKQLGVQATEALPPDGGGSGKVFTRKQINDMDASTYAKNREAILTAQKEGRIK